MKILKYIPLVMLVVLLGSCGEDNYELHLPMSDLGLNLPGEGELWDLNDMSVKEYTFSWKEVSEGGNTLIVSASPVLLNPVVLFDVGKEKSFTITSLDADARFSALGIKTGNAGTLYWTVKPTDQLSVAATEIRTLTLKRMISDLATPEDQQIVSLDGDAPDKRIEFSWKVDGDAPDTEYQLCFGMTNGLEENKVTVDAGTEGKYSLTHQQVQDLLLALPIARYSTNKIYWNALRKEDGSRVSRSSNVLFLNDMMIFTDVRGDESITYKVAKLKYSNGATSVWLAENLRTTRYADGTVIPKGQIWEAPANLSEDIRQAYGRYYSIANRKKVVPAGWRLPTKDEYAELFREAGMCTGQWNVLKHPVYYHGYEGKENVNAWGMNLSSAGYVPWAESVNVENHQNVWCYLLTGDLDRQVILHDGGPQLWPVEVWGGAPMRLIYEGK